MGKKTRLRQIKERRKNKTLFCNPEFKERCGFRGKDRRCFWEDTCNQKRIKVKVKGRQSGFEKLITFQKLGNQLFFIHF